MRQSLFSSCSLLHITVHEINFLPSCNLLFLEHRAEPGVYIYADFEALRILLGQRQDHGAYTRSKTHLSVSESYDAL